jgi:hypothetical protein
MVCDGSEAGPTKAFRDAAAAAIRIGILNFSRKPNFKNPVGFRRVRRSNSGAWAWVMHSCFLGTAWNQAIEQVQDYHHRNWQLSAMSIRGVAERTIRQNSELKVRPHTEGWTSRK